jgi:hypothetical protein
VTTTSAMAMAVSFQGLAGMGLSLPAARVHLTCHSWRGGFSESSAETRHPRWCSTSRR